MDRAQAEALAKVLEAGADQGVERVPDEVVQVGQRGPMQADHRGVQGILGRR